MTSVYPADKDRTFTIVYEDGEGTPVTPASASYTVLDEDGATVVVSTVVDVSGGPVSSDITVLAADNAVTVGQTRSVRSIVLSFSDGSGNDYEKKVVYIIEKGTVMTVGTNAFTTFERYLMLREEMPLLEEAVAAADRDLKMALINGYYNIGGLLMNFGDEFPGIYTTMDLGSTELASITSATLKKLMKANLIEANAILGGNPVEDRRKMGLMSHSAGESAHFFRPTKPLDLPVFKETAKALSGLVRYSVSVSR